MQKFFKWLGFIIELLLSPKEMNEDTKDEIQGAIHHWVHPLKNPNAVITSKFGMRIHPISKVKKFHNGVDYSTTVGTPIYATVTPYKYEIKSQPSGAGNYIKLWCNDGFGNEYWIYYFHLDEATDFGKGLPERGQFIGYTGNSGSSTGPHLHFEVRIKNPGHDKYQPIEPTQFFG